MNIRVVVIGLGVAALAAGCGSGSSGGSPSAPPTGVVVTPTPTPRHTHTEKPAPTPTITVTPTPTTTVTVTSAPAAASCTSSNLKLKYGIAQGTAGTSYTVLVLTNTGSASCTLYGYPGVSLVNASGAEVGPSAVEDPGHKHLVTLAADGGQANALLRSPDQGNYAKSACKPKPVSKLRLYPPGETVPMFVHASGTNCTTNAGRIGIGPVLPGNGG